MGDTHTKIRLAAVQAAPAFLDHEASVEKACRLIREAGGNGADVIGFPEGFIPTHPGWFKFLPTVGDQALLPSRELFKDVLDQDRVIMEGIPKGVREREMLIQSDVGVARIRRTMKLEAQGQARKINEHRSGGRSQAQQAKASA